MSEQELVADVLSVMDYITSSNNYIICLALQVQLVIVTRNFLLPFVFTLAQYAEKFHPRTALKMMLIR